MLRREWNSIGKQWIYRSTLHTHACDIIVNPGIYIQHTCVSIGERSYSQHWCRCSCELLSRYDIVMFLGSAWNHMFTLLSVVYAAHMCVLAEDNCSPTHNMFTHVLSAMLQCRCGFICFSTEFTTIFELLHEEHVQTYVENTYICLAGSNESYVYFAYARRCGYM